MGMKADEAANFALVGVWYELRALRMLIERAVEAEELDDPLMKEGGAV